MLKLDIFNKEIQSSEQRFDSVYILESGDASNAPTISGYLPANYIFGDISAPINIVQANNAPDQTIDIVSAGVQLTRGSYGVLYNPLYDSEGDNNPTNTEWNKEGWTGLENVTGRTYQDFYDLYPGNFANQLVGSELIMHDTSTDKYYKVIFDTWQAGAGQNPNYRGFSYTRTELGYKQEVTGLVNFTTRPTINGSGVLLVGEAAIDFGVDGTRTTLSGTATQNRKINLPDTDGTLIASISTAPELPNSLGTSGQMYFDSNFLYVCISDGIWRRAQLFDWEL